MSPHFTVSFLNRKSEFTAMVWYVLVCKVPDNMVDSSNANGDNVISQEGNETGKEVQYDEEGNPIPEADEEAAEPEPPKRVFVVESKKHL